MPTPRVLVAEDDQAIAFALQIALESEGIAVVVTDSLRAALDAAERAPFDVALLDVRMERADDGLTIARRLRADRLVNSILFVTAADDLASRLDGFTVGGDDYLTKPFAMAELVARVRALLRRGGKSLGGTWRIGDLEIDESAACVRRRGNDTELTPTEFAVFMSLASRPGHVIAKDELLRKVWGFNAFDENVVEVHVSALRRKLEAYGERVVHTVRGGGYVFRGSAGSIANDARNAPLA